MGNYYEELKRKAQDLEDKINHDKKENIENEKIKKNTKMDRYIREAVIYGGVIAGITFSQIWLKRTPFKMDNIKAYLNRKTELDSLGNVRYEEEYSPYRFKNDPTFYEDNTITYVGKWKEDKGGLYAREIKIYDAKKIYNNLIKTLVRENKIDLTKELLGEPINTHVEKKRNISAREYNTKPYLMATIYSVEKEYKIVKQSVEDNEAETLLYICLLTVWNLGYVYPVHEINKRYNRFLEEEYPSHDIDSNIRYLKALKEELKEYENEYKKGDSKTI